MINFDGIKEYIGDMAFGMIITAIYLLISAGLIFGFIYLIIGDKIFE